MTPPTHGPVTLLGALLSVIEQRIVPLTAQGVSSGSKLFGAVILRKSDLAVATVATRRERASPLRHGEITCIHRFFASSSPPAASPGPASTTFFHLFTYENSRDLFAIPRDIRILEEVFRVRAADGVGEDDATRARRPLYNRFNGFFTACSFAELAADIEDRGSGRVGGRGQEGEGVVQRVEQDISRWEGTGRYERERLEIRTQLKGPDSVVM
ncbi:hypothetical protein DL767_008969 [Monosporascus sp. MG133]|nr:hypothetical protein DL767_008969 [Monosporascus sp. MG133]